MGTAALILGANFPDVDAVAYFAGPMADLEWRRGWTHGVLALVLLPILLTVTLILLHRLRLGSRNGARDLERKQLLLLSYIAVLSHPVLDTLNTYGVRWLMPFSRRWFYGDTLFIVDPWVWLMLAAGIIWSWLKGRGAVRNGFGPARWALGAVALYTGAMALTGLAVRDDIMREVDARYQEPVLQAMAGPLPLTVLTRSFVVEQAQRYVVGTVQVDAAGAGVRVVQVYPRGRPSHPAFAVAESTTAMRRFLGWARFPTFSLERVTDGAYLVHAVDLRYARERGERFGSVTIPIRLPE